MKLLLELLTEQGFLVDALGVIGLGMLAFGAARLSQRWGSWGGSLMAFGAIFLLLGRLWVLLLAPWVREMSRRGGGDGWWDLLSFAPPTLLTLGLAGVVWGFWGHEKWLKEGRS